VFVSSTYPKDLIMNTSRLLASLVFAGTLFGSVAFAEDKPSLNIDNGRKQAVVFSLHGKTSCVLVDDQVFCTPAPKLVRLASTDSN
jgi:hypothetical protein